MKPVAIIAPAAALMIGRAFITPRLTGIPSLEGAYEAVAHLFVGFLVLVPAYDWHQQLGPSRKYGMLGLALTAWEGAWFLFQRHFAS